MVSSLLEGIVSMLESFYADIQPPRDLDITYVDKRADAESEKREPEAQWYGMYPLTCFHVEPWQNT